MSEYVNFIQGSKENYNPSEMLGGIFFSKDSKEILLNGGSYGNATPADEEDITAESGNLKLKDRTYDEASFSGKGYKILRKNITEGKNILTLDMINEPNTIYEIRYDYDLNEGSIIIPEGCILKFEGGSLNNGTISSKEQLNIENTLNKIFYNITFTDNARKGIFNLEWFTDKYMVKDSLVDASDDLEYIFNLNLDTVSFASNRCYYITRTLNIISNTNVISPIHKNIGGNYYDINGDEIDNAIVTDKKITMISWTPIGIRKLKSICGFNLYSYYIPESDADLLECEDIGLFKLNIGSDTALWGLETNINIGYLNSNTYNGYRVYLFSGFQIDIENGGYLYNTYIKGSIIGCERALYCSNSGNVSDLFVFGNIRCCRGGWDGPLNTLIIDCETEPSLHPWKTYTDNKLYYFYASGGTIWCRNRIWDLRDEFVPYAISANKVFYEDNDAYSWSNNGYPTKLNDVRYINPSLVQNVYNYKDEDVAGISHNDDAYLQTHPINTFSKGVIQVNGINVELKDLMDDWTGIFSCFQRGTVDTIASCMSHLPSDHYIIIPKLLELSGLSSDDISSVKLIINIKTFWKALGANADNLAFLMLYNNYWNADIEVKNVSSRNENNYTILNFSVTSQHKNSVFDIIRRGSNYDTLDITYTFSLTRLSQVGSTFMNLPFAALCFPINTSVTSAGGIIAGRLESSSFNGFYKGKSNILFNGKNNIGVGQRISTLNTDIKLAEFYVEDSDIISFEMSYKQYKVFGCVDARDATIFDMIATNGAPFSLKVEVYNTNILYNKRCIIIYINTKVDLPNFIINHIYTSTGRITFHDIDYKSNLAKTVTSRNLSYNDPSIIVSPNIGQTIFSSFRNKAAWYISDKWVDAFGYPAHYRSKGKFNERPTPTQDESGFMFFDTYNSRPIYWNGTEWVNSNGNNSDDKTSGTTAERPALDGTDVGFQYFDTTLNKCVYWNGSKWVTSDGLDADSIGWSLIE